MAQSQAQQGVVWTKDARRNQFCQPGQLIYSAKMDASGIACWYRMMFCQCCCLENVVSRTYVDVHSNAVVLSTPFRMCCCECDNVNTAFYDRRMFVDPVVQAGCCKPFPHFCLHFCGCCGDALAFPGGCCACPDVQAGHLFAHCGLFFPVNVMYGLMPGEGLATAMIINNEVAKFRAGPYKEPVTNQPQIAPVIVTPMVGVAYQQAGQAPAGKYA